MSLYKDASLVMIPSAYKDGKLYSIRPTDGSGDFTFSRGSNLAATRVDVNGLIEKGRENLLLQSNQFDTTWTLTNATLISGQTGYDGSSDAWLLNTTNIFSSVRQSISQSGVQTLSVYAKAGSYNFVRVACYDGSSIYDSYFNLQNGTLGTALNEIDANIKSIGNGWYRCSVSVNTNTTEVRIYSAEADNSGSGTSGSIYIQDAQLEQGLVATDYIETGTSAAQSGILEDMPRLDYSGGASCPSLLLEPQRTNAISQSEYLNDSSVWVQLETIVTPNEAISPEGLQNACKLLALSGFANHQIDAQNISISSGAVTGSVFAKKGANADWLRLRLSGTSNPPRAWFDLENGIVGSVDVSGTASIEDVGNGWYRCSLTEAGNTASGSGGRLQIFINKSDGQTQFTSNGDEYHYIYGAQFEQGSYPTSYIPTYGTSQTRSGDSSSLTGASSIIGQTQGTIFVEYDFDETRSNNGGSDNDIIHLRNSSGELIKIVHYGDGSGSAYKKVYLYQYKNSQYEVTISSPVQSTGRMKVAAVYRENYYALFLNGVKIGEDLNAGVPNLDLIYLNKNTGLVQVTNPRHQAVLFPTALTDSECIALTTI